MARLQDNVKRLCLVDDLKEVQDHIHIKSRYKLKPKSQRSLQHNISYKLKLKTMSSRLKSKHSMLETDTESEPFEDEAEAPESPYFVAPPTCCVKESEDSNTFGARSTSSNSTTLLSPDLLLTHASPVLVPSLCRTAHMAVCVSPAMSPGLSAGIAEVAAMSDLTFCKRFRSFYDSSPSPTLPVRKRYRCTSELILKDEDPVARDEGLATGDEGLGVGVESYGLDDESRGLDDEGHSAKSDGFGLGEEEEAEPEGQQRTVLIVGTVISEPLRLGYGALSLRDQRGCWRLAPPVQTPPSTEWSSGSFPISSTPSIVPSPISSPMMSLTVPSPIALPMATLTATIPIDEDQFIEDRIAMMFGALWRSTLALEAWAGPFEEDAGPTVEDEDPVARDEGLATGDEGLGVGVESYGLDDESRGLDDEGHSAKSDGFGLGEEEEAEPEGQQRIVLIVGTVISERLGLGYGALSLRDQRGCRHLAPPVQTPPSIEWSSGSFPISSTPSIVPSPISSPMMSLTVPSPIALPVATLTATIPIDEDQFIEERISMMFGALWRSALALEAWAGPRATGDERLCYCVGIGEGP
nr:hypothetical protein [Tanacetum cinerariifolium]